MSRPRIWLCLAVAPALVAVALLAPVFGSNLPGVRCVTRLTRDFAEPDRDASCRPRESGRPRRTADG